MDGGCGTYWLRVDIMSVFELISTNPVTIQAGQLKNCEHNMRLIRAALPHGVFCKWEVQNSLPAR